MINLKNKTCCFTGHRKIPPEQLPIIARRLRIAITQLIEQGYLYFGAGGALGFDTLAAQTVLKLKIRYPQIKLILVLPCVSQDKSWRESDRITYHLIIQKADKVVYTSKEYTRDCMHRRNRHLVDNSSVCICYLTEITGGTAYTVRYAERESLKIINTTYNHNHPFDGWFA